MVNCDVVKSVCVRLLCLEVRVQVMLWSGLYVMLKEKVAESFDTIDEASNAIPSGYHTIG